MFFVSWQAEVHTGMVWGPNSCANSFFNTGSEGISGVQANTHLRKRLEEDTTSSIPSKVSLQVLVFLYQEVL